METKDNRSLTSVNPINLKIVFGTAPGDEPHVVDITESIPKEMVDKIRRDLKDENNPPFPGAIGVSPGIIGAIETFYYNDGNSDRIFLPLMNPLGACISLEQEINRLLTGAIVNQKQLEALKESVHEIFSRNNEDRRHGVEHVYMEHGI